ncbi:MAG: hypothetical protein RLY93_09000 [Sumerlaeia bacterium]
MNRDLSLQIMLLGGALLFLAASLFLRQPIKMEPSALPSYGNPSAGEELAAPPPAPAAETRFQTPSPRAETNYQPRPGVRN